MLHSLREEQGREKLFIPQDKRTRERDELDPVLQERLEWLSRIGEKLSPIIELHLQQLGHKIG